MKQNGQKLTPVEEFIVAWQRCRSHAEVAKATNLSTKTVGSRATQLRKIGVPLKRYDRPSPMPSIRDLVKLAESSLKD